MTVVEGNSAGHVFDSGSLQVENSAGALVPYSMGNDYMGIWNWMLGV